MRKIDKAPKEWSEIQSLMEKADRLTGEAGSGGKSFSTRQYAEVKGFMVGRGEFVANLLATSQESQGTEPGM